MKDAAKHGGASVAGSYKAKVIDFRMSPGMKSIAAVQVQHAYMRRQLDLDPTANAACNCRSCFGMDLQIVSFEAFSN